MHSASAFDFPEASPGFLLWQVTNTWQRSVRDALRLYDLTHVQFVLLASASWLAWHSGPPSQRELAEHIRADEMMTSQVLRALERKQLVQRVRDVRDARAYRISTTRAGRLMADRAIAVVEAVDAAFFGVLGTDHPEFLGALARLANGNS